MPVIEEFEIKNGRTFPAPNEAVNFELSFMSKALIFRLIAISERFC